MQVSATLSTAAGSHGWLAQRDFRNAHIHMIGVGGSGMAGLAAMLLNHGAVVTGSDRSASAALERLAERGARITTRQGPQAVPADAEIVVYSAAIPEDHPELAAARSRGLRTCKYAHLLGAMMTRYEGIAISGTHGKSTTTACLAFVLQQAGLRPNFVVGAESVQLGGGSGAGGGPHFVAEACEYQRSFLNLQPRYAVVLNIEEDHLDFYPDMAAIRQAFKDFVRLLPENGLLVMNGHDAAYYELVESAGCPAESFGLTDGFTWQACELELVGGRYAFTVKHRGTPLGRVRLALAGRHNVLNALAVIALAQRCGVGWEALAAALREFTGAQRRLELCGEAGGVTVADDYAHHPTEIRATLAAARERFAPKRVWCVFQPHQHSRTRFLLSDFALSFALADKVVVPDIYFVRDSQRDRELVCAQDLVDRICGCGGDATHIASFHQIANYLTERLEPGDLVLTMGAGDIWKVADELVQRLRGNLPG